jgi:hypothetical protein
MPRYYSSAREKNVLFIIVHGCESKDILLATCIHLLGIRENPRINREKLNICFVLYRDTIIVTSYLILIRYTQPCQIINMLSQSSGARSIAYCSYTRICVHNHHRATRNIYLCVNIHSFIP